MRTQESNPDAERGRRLEGKGGSSSKYENVDQWEKGFTRSVFRMQHAFVWEDFVTNMRKSLEMVP